jgi:hypothetical protein
MVMLGDAAIITALLSGLFFTIWLFLRAWISQYNRIKKLRAKYPRLIVCYPFNLTYCAPVNRLTSP